MLKTILKRTFQVLLLAFIVIQFIRPAKNKSETMSKNDISTLYPVPTNVQAVLKSSCTDCHSNNTVYPWYAKIQPVYWWLDDHVRDGKKHLDLSEFATYSLRKQYHKLEEIEEMVKEGEMPLESYTWMHKDAKLTAEEKTVIYNFVKSTLETMKSRYPIDSLVRKK